MVKVSGIVNESIVDGPGIRLTRKRNKEVRTQRNNVYWLFR